MSNLHDARVEEIAEVMADMNGEPRVGRYERTLATVALKNADALVTVEMIAEVLRRHQDFTPGDSCRCGWVATVGDSSHARHQAFKLIELLRGGDGVTR